MTFSEEEIERYHIIFSRFDTDASGTIDFNELKATINDMGQYPTDDELKQMIDEVDDDGSHEIEFSEFLKVVEIQTKRQTNLEDETDTVGAFVALGGNSDKTGIIFKKQLEATVKLFDLTIDVDALCREIDQDGNGEIDYEEFKSMFKLK